MKRKLLTGFALLLCASASAFNYSSEGECLNNNYVAQWGRLKLVGNQLSSQSGEAVQLRGWSTHGHQWSGYPCFDDENDFKGMKGYGANIARIAMYINEGGWVNETWVKNCIDWTASQGMYCLVDWHVLNPGTPTSYFDKNPEGFFSNISAYVKQKNYKHVIYEICNEPNENTEGDIYRPKLWQDIKTYADRVLPAIAKNDPEAVVVVGTPQWDQALVHAVEDPIKNNYGLQLMYAFHYYACSHEQYLGGLQAAAGSIPVFVTEWGTTEHKGQNGLCRDACDMLMDVCRGLNLGGQKISWCNWSFSTEGGESKSLNSANNYSESNLSNSGKYILSQLRAGDVKASDEKGSRAYNNQPLVIKANEETILRVENYDEGGEGVGYHDYDADWLLNMASNPSHNCNAGVGTGNMDQNYRKGECVDVSYIDPKNPDLCNVGYVVAGEWLRYTVDVEKAGYYRILPYANAHKSANVIALSVDGKNAVRDLNDKENTSIGAVKIKVNGAGQSDGGYDDWAYTRLYSDYDGKDQSNTDYGIYFDHAGKQTISLTFFTESAGLGPIRFVPENVDNTWAEDVKSDALCHIYPNPTADGSFTVETSGAASVEVFDAMGRLCFTARVDGTGLLNTGLGAGLYVVKVKTDNALHVKKLVVK